MSELFYKLEQPIISNNLKDAILTKTLQRLSICRTYDCVGVVAPVNHPEIIWLLEQCNLKFYTMIVAIPPRFSIPRHIDPPRRNTLFVMPISPKINYAPTVFYNYVGDSTSQLVCEYFDDNAVILNATVEHDVSNTSNEYRINFQLCFHEPFNYVVEKYRNLELFKFQKNNLC